MKFTRNLFALVLSGIVWISALPVLAQPGSGEEMETVDDGVGRSGLANLLWDRYSENPELAPEALRQQLFELQASLDRIRAAWISEYRPGDEASLEDFTEARRAFREAYATQLEANKRLRAEVMRELRAEVRNSIDESKWNEEARSVFRDYRKAQAELVENWKTLRESLGDDATREDLVAVRERFKIEHAESIARQKALAKQLRQLVSENREPRRERRESLPPELRELREEVAALREQMRTRKLEARQSMEGLSSEEREAYRRDLLEEFREINADLQARRRELIEEAHEARKGKAGPEE